MKLPGQLEAEIALKGIWVALAGLAFLAVVAVAIVQTVRLEGFGIWPLKIEGALAANERLTKEVGSCELRVSTSNRSIEVLEQELQDIAIAAGAKEAELNRRRAEAERRAERLEADAARSQRRIDALRRMAGESAATPGRCEAPAELLKQLEGL